MLNIPAILISIPLVASVQQTRPPELTTKVPATETVFKMKSFERIKCAEVDGAALTPGPKGSWDSFWVGSPDVHFDGKIFRMYYCGGQVPAMYTGEECSIGLAISKDGIHWERANGGKPVLEPGPPGSFDEAQVEAPSVLYDGKIWRMWYCGLKKPGDPRPPNSKMPQGWEWRLRIGLATSKDGIHWTRENGGKPVIDLGPVGSTDYAQVMHPTVIREGNWYRMWYAANSPTVHHNIAMATSRDGVHWTKFRRAAPVEGLGWYITGPAAYKLDNEYLLLYSPEDLEQNFWYVGAAVSTDGFHWKVLNDGKQVAEPPPSAPSEGVRRAEEGSCHHPSTPIRRGNSLWFWYNENVNDTYRIAAGKIDFDWK